MISLLFAAFSAVFISSMIYFAMGIISGSEGYENRKIKSRIEGLFLAKSSSMIEKKTSFSSIFRLNQALQRQPLSKKLFTLLALSGWNISLSVFIMADFLWASFVFFVSSLLFSSMFAVLPVTFLAALLPYWVLVFNKNRYVQKFTIAFPDALMMIKSALKAGQGIQSAFQMVAREGPQPVAREFAQVVHEMELGSQITEALNELHRRIGTLDLRIFVLGIFIQTEVGGNLVELMSHVETTIRDRLAMMREIRALSAQGKMTGLVLILLPIGLAAVLLFMNPGYFNPLLENEEGKKILIFAVIMQFIGGFLIRRITNFKVA